jgi:hypothetical protein
MYATQGVDRYAMIKIEQQDRLARAHRRLAATAIRTAAPPVPEALFGPIGIGSTGIRRRAAVALVTFLLGLGLLAGAAAAQDRGTSSARADNGCVEVVGTRTVC